MARRGSAASPVFALLLLAVFVALFVAFYTVTSETPTGDGVPGPAEWARREHSAGP